MTRSFRVLVTGGRDYGNRAEMYRVLDVVDKKFGPITTIVQGQCLTGADLLARDWAFHRIRACPDCYAADWEGAVRAGLPRKAAGPIRNRKMVLSGIDLCVAFAGGTGTSGTVALAYKHNVPVMKAEDIDP